jgi:succinoglycan biosynthesis protein ExoO
MQPVISVIVANYNGAFYLAEALTSILAQSFAQIEVLLVDDHSADASLAIARGFAAQDSRVQVLSLPENAGPAAARNHALRIARGDWVAMVDSDDFIHPERLQRLLDAALAVNADIIADDQLVFDDAGAKAPRRLLCGARAGAPSWITTPAYIGANRLFSKAAPLGYLKPLIRTAFLRAHAPLYNERLKIAEDYDLILRLLVRGARFYLLPELLYFYRRHGGSISHRLRDANVMAMKTADAAFRHWAGAAAIAPLQGELDARLASLDTAQAVEACIAALKARAPLRALRLLTQNPSALPIIARLATPVALFARLRRTAKPATEPTNPQPLICVLSRQRLIAGANGSTEYLLSLCRFLRESGFRLHLVCPSPAILGRVPVLRVAGAGEVFERISISGTWSLAGVFLARNPVLYARALLAVADNAARRLGFNTLSVIARPAPYAVAAPWAPADQLFIATATRGRADIVLADYAFLTPGIPFAARPGAASAVVMHDLISSRAAHFAGLSTADSMAALAAPQEAALLAQARLVVAIQDAEADAVRRLLPGQDVITAPMALTPVPAAQPGQGGGLLFVGSGTAPNVDAVLWFLDDVWPLIRARNQAATLTLAGTVCAKLGATAHRPGVQVLGRVADLAPLYSRADVVISPLRAGSGLKIKLVEALAHGKAVVATHITAQGVETLVAPAVILADQPHSFADGVLHLLAHPKARLTRAAAGLNIARQHFAPAAGLATALQRQLPAPVPTPHFDWPFVTIVVPCLNEERYIATCLDSLVSQVQPGQHEILVIDGGSTDATRAIVAAYSAHHPSVRLLHNPDRLQSAAVNLAAQRAHPSATVLLRADAHAHYQPNFVRNCVRDLLATGATSVVVPMHTGTMAGKPLQAAIAAAQSSRLGNGGAAHRIAPTSRFVDHGHHAAFNLAFFRQIGGYDPTFATNEDAELDIRAARAGGKVWMCAHAPVTYYPRDTFKRLALQYYRHGTGRARTLRKHHLRPRLRQVAPVAILAGCLAGLGLAPIAPAPAALVLLYPVACFGWGATQAVKHGKPELVMGGAALITMHLSWATGFLRALTESKVSVFFFVNKKEAKKLC